MATTAIARPVTKRRLIHWGEVAKYLLLAVLFFGVLFPMVWVLSSSFKTFEETFQAPRRIIPAEPTLNNYVFLVEKLHNFPRQVLNSLIVTFGTLALSTFLATLMGYGFARIDFRGRDLLFYAVMISMFIPRSGGLMAQYELMSFLKLRDKLIGLILAFASGLTVPMFVMRQSFLYVPHELEESAAIDGATTWQKFWHVALPMCTSGLVVICILKFVQAWGDYLFTLTMMDNEEHFTAAVGVAIVRSVVGSRTGTTADFGIPIAPMGVLAAAAAVVMAPVIILYIALQKWFVRGLTEGILKF